MSVRDAAPVSEMKGCVMVVDVRSFDTDKLSIVSDCPFTTNTASSDVKVSLSVNVVVVVVVV